MMAFGKSALGKSALTDESERRRVDRMARERTKTSGDIMAGAAVGEGGGASWEGHAET
jgi:hypothetical protein